MEVRHNADFLGPVAPQPSFAAQTKMKRVPCDDSEREAEDERMRSDWTFTFGLDGEQLDKRFDRGQRDTPPACPPRGINGSALHHSELALLLSSQTAVYSRDAAFVVLESIWLPSIGAVLYNVVLYVVIHVAKVDSVIRFLDADLTSEPRLGLVGAVLGFLVAFATNQFVASNRELAIYFAEICANLRSLAMLLAMTRRLGPRDKYGFATPSVAADQHNVGLDASKPDKDCGEVAALPRRCRLGGLPAKRIRCDTPVQAEGARP